MKKYTSFLLVASLMFSFATTYTLARADNNSGENKTPTTDRPLLNNDLKTKREDFKGNMQTNRDVFRQKMESEREDFKANLEKEKGAFNLDLQAKKDAWKTAKKDEKAKFCEKAKEMVNKRFEFAITQLETYQAKVVGIITQLKADGKDTTLAQEALDLSKQKLADAKTKLAETKALVPDTCDSLTQDVFAQIKTGAKTAKDLLKESKNSLHQAVQEIKVLKGEDQEDNNNSSN